MVSAGERLGAGRVQLAGVAGEHGTDAHHWIPALLGQSVPQQHQRHAHLPNTHPAPRESHVCLTNSRTQQHSKHTQCEPVPQDQRSLTVDALQPESEYRLQVQVLSGAGHGPSVSKTLHTPHVNGTLL